MDFAIFCNITVFPALGGATIIDLCPAPTGATNPMNHMDGTASDFVYDVENDSLFIRNFVDIKQIYIKIAGKNGKKHLLFSDFTNEEI